MKDRSGEALDSREVRKMQSTEVEREVGFADIIGRFLVQEQSAAESEKEEKALKFSIRNC